MGLLGTKDEYALKIEKNATSAVALKHPIDAGDIMSWTYKVEHTVNNRAFIGKGTVTLSEIFDFHAEKVVTLEPGTRTITNVQDFEGDGREEDVQAAAEWLERRHPNWYYTENRHSNAPNRYTI